MFETGKVKEFIDRCHPFFYYDEPSVEKDEEIRRYYRLALEDVQGYLTSLLREELEGGSYKGAGVSLILPLGDMHIHVGSEAAQEGEEPDYIYTPIGRMDLHTYTAVIRDDGNPVRMLYGECMAEFLFIIHSKLAMEPDGLSPFGVISKEWLRKYYDCTVNDPLGLYRYDSLWKGLDGFFKGYQAPDARDGVKP